MRKPSLVLNVLMKLSYVDGEFKVPPEIATMKFPLGLKVTPLYCVETVVKTVFPHMNCIVGPSYTAMNGISAGKGLSIIPLIP